MKQNSPELTENCEERPMQGDDHFQLFVDGSVAQIVVSSLLEGLATEPSNQKQNYPTNPGMKPDLVMRHPHDYW